MVGKAKATELLRKWEPAINVINEIMVVYPEFGPGQLENIKLLLLKGEWESSKEKTDDILYDNSDNILALRTAIFLA